jgi:hypothetical protein
LIHALSRRELWIGLAAALPMAGCGYRVAGRADLLPRELRTIAVPAFENVSTRYQLTSILPREVAREFISRTRYDIVADEHQADAILRGAVANYFSHPTVFDPVSGRASVVQVSIVLRVSLVERATGKVLFDQPHLEMRERYEISVDQTAFFEESDVALQRMSRDFARRLVTAVLENF